MKILIAGSHGMVGTASARTLTESGHEVIRLVRHQPGAGEIWWDPDRGQIDEPALEGFDGVVQLATMPWPLRWTAGAKDKIRRNRLATNGLLAETLARRTRKPRVLVCASGMGYYATSGDELLTEDCPAGGSFLASMQQAGEAATAPASEAGIRVVNLRIPAVIGGAALQRTGFQAGDGQQWTSWIGLDELAAVIEFALTCDRLSGAVNAVSPNPLRNFEFAQRAVKALGQKPGGTMPAFIVRVVMGEMGQELLLASRRMQPTKLLAAGYQFKFPDLEQALEHEKGS